MGNLIVRVAFIGMGKPNHQNLNTKRPPAIVRPEWIQMVDVCNQIVQMKH